MSAEPSVGLGDWPGRLIRPGDSELEHLSNTPFLDATQEFKLGAGDQALVAATLLYAHRSGPGPEVLELAVPRGSHDVALCVAMAVQLTQLDRLASPITSCFTPWHGSVVVIGHNTAVQRRLGELRVRGIHMRGGVADALRAHRIRSDGCLARPDGSVVPHNGGSGRLLYLNTRTAWPALPSEQDPLVIVDATRIGNSANVGRALEWAAEHDARHVVVVTHLGDSSIRFDLDKAGRARQTFDLAPGTCEGLVYELGAATGDARVSTNRLTDLPAATLRIRAVGDNAMTEGLFNGLRALSNARGSRETWPFAVGRAHRLLTALRRLVVDVDSYNKAAAADPWLSELFSARRVVERSADLPKVKSRMRTFAVAHWGTVRAAALETYDLLADQNPKLEALLDEVDRALRDETRKVVVRVPDRAAVQAATATMTERLGESVMERVAIVRVGEVRPWVKAADGRVTEILPGAPPMWDASWLFTGESTDRIVLAYPFEQRWIQTSVERQMHDLHLRRSAFYSSYGLGEPPQLHVTVEARELETPQRLEQESLTIDNLWERILSVDEPPPATYGPTDNAVRHGPRTGEPELTVVTDDGRAHLYPRGHEVEVFVAGKYRVRLADELQVGDTLLYRAGAGRETLFTRLVSASHQASGVEELDLFMRKFRDACRRVRSDAGSWAEGNRQLVAAGAVAGTQLQAWATGDTIAPADANDVRVVARLAGDENLAKNWHRIEALAQELRALHQRLGRVLSSAVTEAIEGGGPHVRRVAELVGSDAAEILDEFTSATITGIKQP